jgi:molecular chaperone DnaJ
MTSRPKGSNEFGQIREERVVNIKIPPGVEEGMQLNVRGEGNEGPFEGVPGDLVVLIEEIPHEKLKREGNNVYYDLYLNFADAALGTSVQVPTINGQAKIKIEPGTQAGKILRLRGKGLPSVNAYGKGDQLINVNVWTPKNLSKEEKSTLQKLKDSENFQPNPNGSDKSIFDRMKEYFS